MGKILSELIERQNLVVINGSDKAEGLITRSRQIANNMRRKYIEESVIDLILTTENIFSQTTNMKVYENKEHILHRKIKTKNGFVRKNSDHNIIETNFNISYQNNKESIMEFYNLNNKKNQ